MDRTIDRQTDRQRQRDNERDRQTRETETKTESKRGREKHFQINFSSGQEKKNVLSLKSVKRKIMKTRSIKCKPPLLSLVLPDCIEDIVK